MSTKTDIAEIKNALAALGAGDIQRPWAEWSDGAKLTKLVHVLSQGLAAPDEPFLRLVRLMNPDVNLPTPEDAAILTRSQFAAVAAARRAALQEEARFEQLSPSGTLSGWDRPVVSNTHTPIVSGGRHPAPVPPDHVVPEHRQAWIASQEFERQRAEQIGKFDEAERGWRLPPKTGPRGRGWRRS